MNDSTERLERLLTERPHLMTARELAAHLTAAGFVHQDDVIKEVDGEPGLREAVDELREVDVDLPTLKELHEIRHGPDAPGAEPTPNDDPTDDSCAQADGAFEAAWDRLIPSERLAQLPCEGFDAPESDTLSEEPAPPVNQLREWEIGKSES